MKRQKVVPPTSKKRAEKLLVRTITFREKTTQKSKLHRKS